MLYCTILLFSIVIAFSVVYNIVLQKITITDQTDTDNSIVFLIIRLIFALLVRTSKFKKRYKTNNMI